MELWIGVTIAVAAISAVGIVVAIKVDFVALLKYRREIRIEQAQRECAHVSMESVDDERGLLHYQSLFTSPPGTISWICERCGFVAQSKLFVERNEQYWKRNWSKWPEQEKKFAKLMRKL